MNTETELPAILTPIAFRIRDYRSIVDTGTCRLSADGVTVLAGQNESGKTNVLTALRDFDLGVGKLPETDDYLPDDRLDEATPVVAIEFALPKNRTAEILNSLESGYPREFLAYLEQHTSLWVNRSLSDGTYFLSEKTIEAWDHAVESHSANNSLDNDSSAPSKTELPSLNTFLGEMRLSWPYVVYFDEFKHTLPRSIQVASLVPDDSPKQSPTSTAARPRPVVPQAVHDFISLSGIDIDKIQALSTSEKQLSNYLDKHSAAITGDFLELWQQGNVTNRPISLKMEAHRNEKGELCLAFYVSEMARQHVDQRSRGFLWFLSFYLRLAAEAKDRERIRQLILVDEPGTFLHFKGQADALRLFERCVGNGDAVVYSTHSPALLPANRLHRVRVVLRQSSDGTKVYDRLSHSELLSTGASDALTPIIAAIGMDIRHQLGQFKSRNVLLEGISDRFYLQGFAEHLQDNLLDEFGLFPCTGADSVVTMASLLIGLGIPFVVLVDRDKKGTSVKNKLQKQLGISDERIVQPQDCVAIEDVFSQEDFRSLLKGFGEGLTLGGKERPSEAVSRQNIDKVLLSRQFATAIAKGELSLSTKTNDRAQRLLVGLREAAITD